MELAQGMTRLLPGAPSFSPMLCQGTARGPTRGCARSGPPFFSAYLVVIRGSWWGLKRGRQLQHTFYSAHTLGFPAPQPLPRRLVAS